MDNLDLFGEYSDDGGELLKDADTCILTGRAVETGDPLFAIGKYFYRVSVSALAQHTDDVRAQLEALVPQPTKKPAKGKAQDSDEK